MVRRNVTSNGQLCATTRTLPTHLKLLAAGELAVAGRLCLGMIASNADIFHSSGVKRGPLLERCEFTVAMDDYLNVSQPEHHDPFPQSESEYIRQHGTPY